jgi:hypothetical protein
MHRRLPAIALAIAATVSLAACSSTTTADPTPATSAAVETVTVDDFAGQNAKDAAAALKEAGFATEYDAGDEVVIMASNWTVDSPKGSIVVLHVSKPDDTDTDAAVKSDLAARTEAAFLDAWGVSSLSELAGDPSVTVKVAAITQWEDVSAGTIRVYVQENLTRDEAKTVGQNIWGLTHDVVPDLTTVVVRGADGVDVNYFG